MNLFAQVCSENSLKNAWNIVKKNSSCSGIDKVTPQKFEEDLNDNIKNLSFELKEGLYKSSPVLKLKNDLGDEKTRPLVIPTVKDRIVMRSVSDVLSPVFEKTFVTCNYAYRPKKSAFEATEDIDVYIQKEYRFFFRTDIKSFFESINHEILLDKLKESIDEEKILKLIKNFLKTRAFGENDIVEPISGLHQGSPISPFMSNIYLNNFDKNMVNHGFQIIRYCDDMLILTKNEEELKDAELLLNFELKKLKLQTNLDKTQKGDLRKGFVFLGYHFNQTGRIASKKAVESLDCKLKNLAIDKKVDDEKIEKVIRGWENYFGSIKNITLNNLESFLSVLKVRSHHEVEKLLEDRNKIQAIAKPNVYLELAIEWKKLAQENMFIKEVAEFFKYVQLYDQMELIKMSELLSISLENLVNIIRNYKKNNFDLGFLAESFVEISSYYLAQKFYELRNETTKLTFNNYGLDCLDEIFFDKYLNLFSGKENIYSIERCDKTGKKVFEKVKRTLKAEQIQEHIEGAITADLHLFKDNYHTSLLVLDIDISKECLSDDENYHRNLKLTLEYALKLSKQAKSYGIDNLIEFSGYKGYHVWFFFEKEVLASKLRDFAFYLLKQVGSCPDGIRCEIFPNKNELIDIEESCVIKLPLGFNSITEARCLFIDNKGNYYPDQRKIVEITKKIDLKTFYEVLKVLEIEKDLVNKDVCLKEETFENLPKTKKVIDNCKVVEFIVKKAEATGYLNHKERTLLLSSIGTLDKEGKEAIHKIMKKCFNYDKGITEKYFNKKFDSPISCKKIKENYREITCLTDCNCVFKNIPKDSYVSPTLYAKESLEKPKPIVKEISEKIELTTKEEPLNIKKKEEKVIVTEKTVEKNATLEIKTTPDNKAIKDDIKENIKKYANLKKQLRGIEKALEKCSDNLNSSFNTLKIEQIELEFGILIREKLNNKINWRLEL